jgi:hypothetical protein
MTRLHFLSSFRVLGRCAHAVKEPSADGQVSVIATSRPRPGRASRARARSSVPAVRTGLEHDVTGGIEHDPPRVEEDEPARMAVVDEHETALGHCAARQVDLDEMGAMIAEALARRGVDEAPDDVGGELDADGVPVASTCLVPVTRSFVSVQSRVKLPDFQAIL